MIGAVTLWRDPEEDRYAGEWIDMAASCPPTYGIEVYRALPVAEFDTLGEHAATGVAIEGVLIAAGLDRDGKSPVEVVRDVLARIAALTADRDALAALLGEARFFVPSHDDVAIRINAALARIDAASGR